jgi:hypothetical protein
MVRASFNHSTSVPLKTRNIAAKSLHLSEMTGCWATDSRGHV